MPAAAAAISRSPRRSRATEPWRERSWNTGGAANCPRTRAGKLLRQVSPSSDALVVHRRACVLGMRAVDQDFEAVAECHVAACGEAVGLARLVLRLEGAD